MSKPSERTGRACARLALALLLAAFCCAQGARAQSGRRAPKASTPPPAAEPTPQGESESVPRQGATKKTDALVSFVVMWYDEGSAFTVDRMVRDDMTDNFIRRLGQSASVSVTSAGKGRRQDARDRAKSESAAYVVLFEIEDESATVGRAPIGQSNPSALLVKTYVYAPKTGDLKYVDTTYQRPYRRTARIGGVGIPVPTRGVERYPSQRELEQAARDAADRLLARFNIAPPPDN
jgi:hypothetical protein